MSAPIGSIEFLVKFDTIGQAFTDALTNAITAAGVGAGGGATNQQLQNDIAMIKYNLLTRVRTPFTGDYLQFTSTYMPEIKENKRAEYRKKWLSEFMKSPTGETFLTGTIGEERKKRATKIMETLLGRYNEYLQKAADDPSFWEKNKEIISSVSNSFNELMAGKWKSLIMRPFDMLFKEKEWKKVQMDILKKAKADILKGEAGRARLTQDIGKGKWEIKTADQFYKLLRGLDLTKAEQRKVFTGKEGSILTTEKLWTEKLKPIFEKFKILSGIQIPLGVAHAYKASYDPKAKAKEYWATRFADIFFTVGAENLKEHFKGVSDLFPTPKAFEDYKKTMKRQLLMSNTAWAYMQGKVVWTQPKYDALSIQGEPLKNTIISGIFSTLKGGMISPELAGLIEKVSITDPEGKTKESVLVILKELLKGVNEISVLFEGENIPANLRAILDAIKAGTGTKTPSKV